VARGELKYWVFDQDKLELQLEEHVLTRVAEGIPADRAQFEGYVILLFLLSPSAKPLMGGRAG